MGFSVFFIASNIDYGRVVLDACLMLLLMIAMFSSIGPNSDDTSKSIHLHEVPIYFRSRIDLGSSWASYDTDTVTKHTAFQASVNSACESITEHPMCTCIAKSTNRETANLCLLSKALPVQYLDSYMSAVSFCLFFWFSSALATSVGTLPFIQADADITKIYTNKWIVRVYALLCVMTVVFPMICIGIFFQDRWAFWSGVFHIFLWSGVSVIAMTAYNYSTIYSYFVNPDIESKPYILSTISSMRHFIFYVNLLVSAPAIATVIHMTLGWAEYHTIINTTLLISSMFAVDAFSAEMVNFWSTVPEAIFEKAAPEKNDNPADYNGASNNT